MRAGVVTNCLNCGDVIGPLVFPHYCPYCLKFLRETGCLPTGLLDQMRLEGDEQESIDLYTDVVL